MRKMLILVIFILATWGFAEMSLTPTILAFGSPLPTTNILTLTDTTVSTTTFKYPLVISVFTTWCAVCKKELPQLNIVLHEAQAQKIPLTIIGIDAGEKTSKVASYQKRQRLDFDLFVDSQLALIKKLQIKGTPVILIFDAKGTLTYQGQTIPETWAQLIQ